MDGTLYLGHEVGDSATLVLDEGGHTSVQHSAYVGFKGNAATYVEGVNSSFEVGENLYLASEAGSSGALLIDNGGSVSANAAFVGMGGSGIVDVNEGATLDLSNQLYLGFHDGATATLNIKSDGEADVLEDVVIGRAGTGYASVIGEGAALNIGEDLVLGLFPNSDGSLTVNNEGTVRVDGDATFGIGGRGMAWCTVRARLLM
ncbi:hypothetical protein [Microbulbifer sp. VAAF005]|uniref:hypothetical protein n=1 Tax=Microbulbifer sp. VAAF005 TaxID=3034230 RepID=UPI0024AE2C4E|nr:hypothetical protein [Microbulbifer sp. VAAF005]WHI45753.1 hypothetical protein P0078_18805 [Microbulbifer sp. VAAF005]